MAKLLNASDSVIGRYELGETTPNIEMATKLTDVLGVSIDYLVGKTDMELDRSILDKIITIQKLPKEDQFCILSMDSFNMPLQEKRMQSNL